jgi:paraquat-inducible protein A
LLVAAALMSLVVSNLFPIAELTARGGAIQLRLWECIRGGNAMPLRPSSLLWMMSTIVLPFGELTNMLYLLLGGRRGTSNARCRLMHLLDGLRPWSMILLYMIGMLVSISRMDTMVVVMPGIALVAMALLMLMLAALLVIDTSDLRR